MPKPPNEEALIHRFGHLGKVLAPLALRSDNGLVFSSKRFTNTVKAYGLTQEFITPYTPEQNGLIERFIRTIKEECIWQHHFENLAHARHCDWAVDQTLQYRATPPGTRFPNTGAISSVG